MRTNQLRSFCAQILLAHLAHQNQVRPGSRQCGDASDAGGIANTEQEAFTHLLLLLFLVPPPLRLSFIASDLRHDL